MAIGNRLVSENETLRHRTKTAQILFLDLGFDGSMKAAFSYDPGSVQGHIWLVDKDRNRDCKGQWISDPNGKYTWEITCPDGLGAAGTLTNPHSGSGIGSGKDSLGRDVVFLFSQ